MSLFLATCQGIGLAVAAGTFAGASGRRGLVGFLLAAPAAIGGAILFAVSLSNRDHPAWPGVLLGLVIAILAYGVVSAVVAGAQARARGASSIGLIVASGPRHRGALDLRRAGRPVAPGLPWNSVSPVKTHPSIGAYRHTPPGA